MIEPGFRERSRAAFADRFPEIVARIDAAPASAAALVVEAGAAIDILAGDRRLYGADARHFAAGQVEAFIRKPLRIFMEQPGAAGLVSEICRGMMGALKQEIGAAGSDEIQRHPAGNPTFLIVFGLGLGHHLRALAEATKARWLILVEPTTEFIEHSFSAIDWSELLDLFAARGGNIRIVTEHDPAVMVPAIVRQVAAEGIPLVDGAYVFLHYPHWSFAEARTKLHNALQFAFVNRGFFEDEVKMMLNAVANFTAAPFGLLEGMPRLRRKETAVVVGAGPSLDESLETLHRIRDRIVLFSGGTSLRPLLRAGLVPDFHCELENVPAVVDVLGEAAKYGDLSEVRLIASATVDPRVPPLFKETLFFFRDAVSSTRLLGQRFRVLSGAAPTCVNTAMVAASTLGFTEFLLFGTDCGVRPGGHQHASGTVYRDVGLYQDSDKKARYPLEVEGNFGGIAKTDWVYDACRRMLAEAITVYHLSAANCSDGALIPGARPLVAEAVELEAPPVDRARLQADLDRALRHFAPAEILADADFPALIARTQGFYGELTGRLDGIDPEAADFAAVFEAIRDCLRQAPATYAGVTAMCDGTLYALPRIGMFYGYRIADPELRRRVFRIFMRELLAAIDEMESRTTALFRQLAGSVTQRESLAIA